MFCYTLDDELKSFYKTNEMYLILVYRDEEDFYRIYQKFTRGTSRKL